MKVTQKERVLDYIERFGGITSYEAFADLGVTRLSAVIFDLKKLGYTFIDENIKRINRYGEPVTFKKYKLLVEED